MEKYEIKIDILDPKYIDQLIVALVHQGYAVYYNKEENVVCYSITEEDITEIKK